MNLQQQTKGCNTYMGWVGSVSFLDLGNLPMSVLCFLLLVFLLQTELLHSVGEQDKNSFSSRCKPFPCGNLGEITFPYTCRDRPECGLFFIDGCEGNVQKIELEEKGRSYQLNSISQAGAITIHDEQLAKQLATEDCESLKNPSLVLPKLPYVSFDIIGPKLTLCKRNGALNSSFPKEFSYQECNQNYTIYYNQPLEMQNDRLSGLCNCPIIQLPLIDPPPHIPSNNHLFHLLSPNISIQVQVTPHCWSCYFIGGQCLVNEKQEFHCSKKKKGT